MSPTKLMKILPPLIIGMVIGGCGFQLRGAAPVPAALQPLAVECTADIPIELCNEVTEQLRLGGVTLAEPDSAAFRLRLTRFEQSQRASAVTLQGSAAEYNLRQRVWMDVLTAQTVPLIVESEVSSSESFRYDEDNVLAKKREQQSIQLTLYQRLAQQIVFRLSPLTEARIQALTTLAEDADADREQGQ